MECAAHIKHVQTCRRDKSLPALLAFLGGGRGRIANEMQVVKFETWHAAGWIFSLPLSFSHPFSRYLSLGSFSCARPGPLKRRRCSATRSSPLFLPAAAPLPILADQASQIGDVQGKKRYKCLRCVSAVGRVCAQYKLKGSQQIE